MKRNLILTGMVVVAILVFASCGSHKETLNEDGTDLIRRPYRWFAGIAEADVEPLAVEMAQMEAYAAISRVIENAVLAESERAAIAINGNVQKALKSHWQRCSDSQTGRDDGLFFNFACRSCCL